MSGNTNGMEDLGGGVSIFSPEHHHSKKEKPKNTEEAEKAFRELSEEIARVTEDVGDPMTIHSASETDDPHLEYFLNNKN